MNLRLGLGLANLSTRGTCSKPVLSKAEEFFLEEWEKSDTGNGMMDE